jgi:hypothetical protein
MAQEEEDGVGEDEGGLSTPKKVVAGAALGVAVPAAVGVARKLLGGDDDASSEPMSRERRSSGSSRSSTSRRSSSSRSRSKSATRPRAKAKTKTKTTAKRATSTARRTVNRTREQLYKQATRLKIEGRSSMNKAQLERAISRAKAKAK